MTAQAGGTSILNSALCRSTIFQHVLKINFTSTGGLLKVKCTLAVQKIVRTAGAILQPCLTLIFAVINSPGNSVISFSIGCAE